MIIEVFKSGEHKDSNGRIHNFSDSTLSEMVEKYNNAAISNPDNLAPLVKGHPESNDPAYGWVDKLLRRGNKIYAKIKDLNQNIINEIENGSYKNVSISLYPDLKLRHVGLLGAVAPAIKGMNPISFNENSPVNILNDLNAEDNLSEIELLRKQQRLSKFRDFAENLVNNQNGLVIPPSFINDIIDLLEFASKFDEQNQNQENSKLNFVMELFTNLKPFLNYSEFDLDIELSNNFTQLNVDSKKLDLHNSALALQKQNRNLSYEEAILQIQKNS